MTPADLAFWLNATVLVLCAAMVATGRDPVRAAMALILAFVSAAGLFILAGAEFLGLMLILTYAGAVMTLFLFVVMMLDIAAEQRRGRVWRYAPMAAVVAVIMMAEILVGLNALGFAPKAASVPVPADIDNARALGQTLYTHWFLAFQLTGVILLATMAGAIVLALRVRRGALSQDVAEQVGRTRAESLLLTRPPVGEGVDLSRGVETEKS